MWRRLRKCVNVTIWTVVGTYLLVVLLLNIPAMKGYIGQRVGVVLGETLHTSVSVGRVDLGLLNRVIIDNVNVCDTTGAEMLRVGRMSVKLSLVGLVKGRIEIASAQLFGMNAHVYELDEGDNLNIQFVIDALSSGNKGESRPLDLKVNSLIVRRSEVSYNGWDVRDISAHVIANTITNDSININLKRLSCREKSGLDLRRLSCRVVAGEHGATLSDMHLHLPSSELHLSADATYTLIRGDTTRVEELVFDSQLYDTHILLADLSPLLGHEDVPRETILASADVHGEGTHIYVKDLQLSQGDNLQLSATGDVEHTSDGWNWHGRLTHLSTNDEFLLTVARTFEQEDAMPAFTSHLGHINMTGEADCSDGEINAKVSLTSGLGKMDVSAMKHADLIRAEVEADSIQMGLITENNDLGTCTLNASLTGGMDNGTLGFLKAEGNISSVEFLDHAYHDATLAIDYDRGKNTQVTLAVSDPLGNLDIDIRSERLDMKELRSLSSVNNLRLSPTTFHIVAEDLCPEALHLTEAYPNTSFSFTVDGELECQGIENARGQIEVSDFSFDTYTMKSFLLTMDYDRDGRKSLTCQSDFLTLLLEGTYDYATLYDSFKYVLVEQMPILPLGQSKRKPTNQFALYATLTPSDFAPKLLGLPLTLTEPAHLIAKFDDTTNTIQVNADAKDLTYNGTHYYDNYIIVSSPSDTIRTKVSANSRDEDGNSMTLLLRAQAFNNRLSSSIDFDSHHKHHIKGSLNTQADFNSRSSEGKQVAELDVLPSEILVSDTTWTIAPAHLTYYENYLKVDNFSILHNLQHININGEVVKGQNNDIMVEMEDVNVAYILDFIGFSAVSFDGYATGEVKLSQLFDDPTILADLTVGHFLFEGGALGKLKAFVGYNFEEGRINIDAVAQEEEWHQTSIRGYVSPKESEIDLHIVPEGTNLDFINTYCEDFARLSNARGSGELRVVGPLGEIQMVGSVTASGDAFILATEVPYHLENQRVNFEPNNIIFMNDTITDSEGHKGVLTGHLPHQHLTRLSYDISVSATNLLALDLKEFGEDPYLGTVYATGSCRIRELTGGGTRIDVNITPNAGSFLTYNATAPDRVSDTFIHWNDPTKRSTAATNGKDQPSDEERATMKDMYINFNINCQDDSQLRVLMDERMGDLISLNGSGMLTANFYNKGAFNVYGNYLVSSGTYRMTIQEVIQRDFTFKEGGTLSFSGDPMEAQINLQAEYSLASVPLSDINIGKSFSNNNVRVDCLMNITGTPENPQVDFSLDMPTISADAKQMIMSMFADNEELNQQVIYLIAIGRFLNQYSSDSEARYSQTSLAMQSFLSGTISQQLNNVLEGLIGNKQWNFGANISPGEEGFNDAEYEGLVSGSMFNSRLLFNGQFGYRDNPNATSSFIGDFDLRYLLVPTGSIAVRIYNETNNRYFTKNTLTTQGVGLIIKKDFSGWRDLFRRNRKPRVVEEPSTTVQLLEGPPTEEEAEVAEDEKTDENLVE